MGSVLRGVCADGTPVAIKVLDHTLSREKWATDRFSTEAVVLAGLDHPNIVRVIKVADDAKPPYFVMEFIDGPDLSHYTKRARPDGLRLRTALDCLADLADAVAAVHAAGLVHLDLKPSNVLVGAGNRVKLCDFGLVRRMGLDAELPSDEVAGTPGYIAPEIARGDAVHAEPSADMFSLGVVAFELVTGMPAFPRTGAVTRRLHRNMEGLVAPAGSLRRIPGPLNDVIRAALSRDASLRPTAVEFAGVVHRLRASVGGR